MNKVLVITSSIDYTVDYIISKYSDRAEFFRVNVDLFSNYRITIESDTWRISCPYWTIQQDEVDSIYYRKPRMPDLSDYQPEYSFMIQRDIIAVVEGLVNSFDKYVLTKPSVLHKAENKILQLVLAKDIPFNVPCSLITNDRVPAQSLIRKTSIIKPLSTGKITTPSGYEVFQTELVSDISDYDISLTPIYLQHYITKQFEVRVTLIGEFAYCVKIDSTDKVDWRHEKTNNHYQLIELPEAINLQCRKMLQTLELDFGAFDFIVDEKGEWVFLEVNPNGQWLWLEKELGLDISERIVDLLT